MKIDLKLYNSILYGDLRPWLEANKSDEKFLQILSPSFKVPKGGPDAFMIALNKAMENNPHFLIEDDYVLEFSENKIKISSMGDEIFEPLINIDIPPYFSPRTEFYYYLIRNEGTRMMNNLNKAIEVCKTEADANFLVKGTLTKIKTLLIETGRRSKELGYSDRLPYNELPNDPIEAEKKIIHYILFALRETLMRLIYEIQEIFALFLGAKLITEDEIYIQYLGETPPSISVRKASAKMNDFATKRYVMQMEYSKEKTLERIDKAKDDILSWFDIEKLPKEFAEQKELFVENIMALENLYFVREFGFEETNPTYEKLVSPKYINEILNKAYSNIEEIIEEQAQANNRLKVLFKEEEKFAFLKTRVKIDDEIYKSSIPRKIISLLKGSRAFIEANLSIDFSKQKGLEFNKIKTNLTVAELALLFRFLMEGNLVTTKYKTELFKTIAATFSSKERDDISANAIKNHYDTPDGNAKDNLHGKLFPLLQIARKFKDS